MRWLRWLRWTLLVIAAVALLAFGGAWWAMHRSLPRLDGTVTAALSAPATIERDARGIPVITAAARVDLAFATGFAHGQDRFFQMDLSRRLAAGELSELFGPVALATDTRTRRFGFRAVARRVVETTSPEERAILEAYTRGVNAGRHSLDARPWEYLLLRATPRDWSPEDSVLVVHSMWWQLQYGALTAEIARRRFERAVAARAGAAGGPEAVHALVAFVYAGHSSWDTPNHGPQTCTAGCGLPTVQPPYPALLKFAGPADAAGVEPKLPGSNSWAVAGVHTRSGAALVANDMHLDLGVPAVWYPARLRIVTGAPPVSAGAPALDITGVTLPGTPAVAAGSNGHVAWGFTNSYGDFSDVRFAPCRGAGYRVRRESIEVRGRDPAVVEYREAGAGVVLDGEEYAADVQAGECAQAGWLALYPEATNFALLHLENARTVDEVLALAPGVGIPAQNLVVGDSSGRIAWTLLGRVPRTRGPDRLFGALEFTEADDHPRISDPPVGRVWTANQRVVDGALEAVLGDDEVDVGAGGYDIGARARQIRDDLVGLARPATEADMLAIQTDSRGLFVARWRELLLALLDDAALRDVPARAAFRELVSTGVVDAVPDAVGYRLVRAFRGNVLDALWHSLATGFVPETAGQAAIRRPAQFEAAGFRLVSERPTFIAPPTVTPGGDWRAFLLERVDLTIESLVKECGALERCGYGARATVAVRHPLSRAVPMLAWLLDMPARSLPGDHHMPRVQDGAFGASERFAVSPGHEAEGYLELPGGPSGHPLSPFYRSGFDDWVAGRPTPFLPGPAAHRLELRP